MANTVRINIPLTSKKTISKALKKVLTEKEIKQKAFRAEASRLASLANKRVARLEANKMEDSPAYRGYIESGGGKFSVKGKTHNELQIEMSRMRKFIKAKTSTLTGIKEHVKEIADITGIKYKSVKELHAKTAKFFELASKVEQYLRDVEDMASAVGYQKIWESINVYTQDSSINLADAKNSVEEMVDAITKVIMKQYEIGRVKSAKDEVDDSSFKWYKLK